MLGEETILFYSFIYIKRLRILLSLLDKNCNFHALFLFQLIFRKVSDVLKEQELAERRKNDPVLNKSEDKLVRKLFNKFKKGPDCGPGGGTVGPDHSKTAPPPLSLSAITNNRLDIESLVILANTSMPRSHTTTSITTEALALPGTLG